MLSGRARLHDATAAILQTVLTGIFPEYPAFDGANIWVPNSADASVTVVQASTGAVVATITSDLNNLLGEPTQASFDGERILVTNADGVTIFKAADIPTAVKTLGACSDGVNFWVISDSAAALLRF